ncbi:hypothetical protein [Luteibacter sp. 22Crub2.1]|uniref:hypothetical protein n=1 Tax=Luteibacter sp. 22Crub2.1 TaxID=1283288 RepID=UPI0009D43B39|nr:hypothetical protein [Luteibacter sp. 22Crub2.1]SKB98188.1 hypothetical protein SAMN05660880_03587 [Luteibacter sp. 22Crub2.1]
MRSTMKVVTAAKACVPLLALLAASVADARSQGLIHEEFIRGDHHARWTLLSLKRAGQGGPTTRSPFHSDEVWRSEYLETPDSIYSDLAAPVALAANEYVPRTGNPREGLAYSEGTGSHPTLVWPRSPRVQSDESGSFPIDAGVNRMIAWNLGLYKALPTDLRKVTSQPFGWYHVEPFDDNARFNLFKADIGPDILEKAMALSGAELSTLGAQLALSIATLNRWSDSMDDPERYGIRRATLAHFWSATTLADLTEQDLSYLADILRMELTVAQLGVPPGDINGAIAIPTPLRVARTAAAWHGSRPGYSACHANGSHDPEQAGLIPERLDRPICFMGATDRAVYRWYRARRATELATSSDDFAHFDQAARLIAHFADVRPVWAGAYADEAADWAVHAEIIEAQLVATQTLGSMASDEAGFLRMTTRANQRICRSREP